MTETVETLGEFVCPICGNKFFSSGEICPHRVIEMLNAQAAEIAKKDAEIERLGLYGAKMFAEVERLRVAIDEIIDLDFPDLGAGWEYKTWEDMTIELKDIARAAREREVEG